MTSLTMVIPTFNDSDSLKILLDLIAKQKSSRINYLIVNNGSTDARTDSILKGSSQYWTSIKLEKNMGFGGGVLAGIHKSDSNWVGWMPGNLKILPENVEKILDIHNLKKNDFLKCRRIRKSRIARGKTFVAGLIQTILTWKPLFDTGGTPTICERTFILSLEDLPRDYLLESRILFEAQEASLNILRPYIPYGERLFGSSHWQRGIRSEIRLMRAIIVDSVKNRVRHNRRKK